MADPKMHEKLDAFRAGHEDGQLPELHDAAETLERDEQLAAAFGSSQAFDRAVQNALDDASVPEGLEATLLSLTGLADTTDSASAEIGNAETVELNESTEIPRRQMGWWLAGAVALAASALAMAFWPSPKPLAPTGVEIAERLNADAERWTIQQQPWRKDLAPADPPIDPAVKMDGATWLQTTVLDDPNAIVYRRAMRRGNVYLVIAHADVRGVGATPPLPPQWDTGSRRIGVWSSLGYVYVLVVEGDVDDYKQVIREPYAA